MVTHRLAWCSPLVFGEVESRGGLKTEAAVLTLSCDILRLTARIGDISADFFVVTY